MKPDFKIERKFQLTAYKYKEFAPNTHELLAHELPKIHNSQPLNHAFCMSPEWSENQKKVMHAYRSALNSIGFHAPWIDTSFFYMFQIAVEKCLETGKEIVFCDNHVTTENYSGIVGKIQINLLEMAVEITYTWYFYGSYYLNNAIKQVYFEESQVQKI